MKQSGHTFIELLVVVAILGALVVSGLPALNAYTEESRLLGAGRGFKWRFLLARSIAAKSLRETAIRFEEKPDGVYYSVYVDGNRNGIRSADILSGVDRRIEGPHRLDSGAPKVRVGINPGVPAIPPDSGMLDPADPIQFGRANMVSFSPLGTATPGTFYLAGPVFQAAVRVSPGSARVRFLVFRGGQWMERP